MLPDCPYSELGLCPGAADDDVKKAFRKMAINYHPDKTQGDAAKTEKFKRIQTAYDRIMKKDETPHEVPDNVFAHTVFGQHGFGIPDMFMHMFNDRGFGMGGAHVHGAFHGPLQNQTIEIPLSECDVKYGCTRKLEFECLDACPECKGHGADQSPHSVVECASCHGRGTIPLHDMLPTMPGVVLACGNCNGTGRLKPPCNACSGAGTIFRKRAYDIRCLKGVPHGQTVQLKQKGSFCKASGTYMDLNILFQYTNFSAKLRVEERDVHIDLDVSLEELLTGFRRILKVYNEEYLVETRGYIDPNVSHKLENEGLPSFNDIGRNGDLHLHLQVKFPTTLSLKHLAQAESNVACQEQDLNSGDNNTADAGNCEKETDGDVIEGERCGTEMRWTRITQQ